jgi:hypothetical protein
MNWSGRRAVPMLFSVRCEDHIARGQFDHVLTAYLGSAMALGYIESLTSIV